MPDSTREALDVMLDLHSRIAELESALEEIADLEGCTIRCEKECDIWNEACEKAFNRCAKIAQGGLDAARKGE